MVNPIPTIICDGAFLSCAASPTGPDGKLVLALDRPTLIGEMAIEWGRDDQWTQPDPSVLTFQLWEPWPGQWLTKIVERKAMRRGVNVVYNHKGDKPGDRSIFQGFTTDVDVKMSIQRTAAGKTMGWLVTIQAADRSGFLGNINWAAGVTLPEESMQNRAVKIRNQAAPLGIREFYFESRFANGTVKLVDPKDKTARDMTDEMYKSFADQWCYNPSRNTINRIPTGSTWGNYDLTMGKTDTDGTIRLYPPPWTDTTGTQADIDKQPYPTAYLGACHVTGEIALSANTVQDITHITCKWFDKPNNKDWKTTVVAKTDTGPPARLEFESWYNNGIYVDPIIEDVRKMVNGDGSRPMHPQIQWDTDKTGDVPDWSTFESMTMPAQTIRMVTLAGSPFSAATGYAPVWHPCGGRIAYRGGKWVFSVNLAPTSMPLDPNRVPITPATIDQRITLDDPNGWRFDHSITPFDLYYVSNKNVYPVP